MKWAVTLKVEWVCIAISKQVRAKAKFKMSDVTVDKSLLAFLNGISKRLYFGEQSISDEFLRDEVLHVSDEGILNLQSEQ